MKLKTSTPTSLIFKAITRSSSTASAIKACLPRKSTSWGKMWRRSWIRGRSRRNWRRTSRSFLRRRRARREATSARLFLASWRLGSRTTYGTWLKWDDLFRIEIRDITVYRVCGKTTNQFCSYAVFIWIDPATLQYCSIVFSSRYSISISPDCFDRFWRKGVICWVWWFRGCGWRAVWSCGFRRDVFFCSASLATLFLGWPCRRITAFRVISIHNWAVLGCF